MCASHGGGVGYGQKNTEEVQAIDRKHGGGAGHRQKNMEEVQVIDRKTWKRCRS